MFLSQTKPEAGLGAVLLRDSRGARTIPGASTTYALATEAAVTGRSLAEVIAARGEGEAVDFAALLDAGRIDLPLRHPDPGHMHLTGTGLTHLGSAAARDAMHSALRADETDSMKMFRMGLAGGRPADGAEGAQPEWFYKGTGHAAVGPGMPLVSPGFARDAGEEPEIAGIYLITPDGTPCRVGFALANEFSDHVTERGNYLWLAHSKLRPAAFGPEIRIGPLPDRVEGTSRIWRDGRVLWEKPFQTGEAHMAHSLRNLEHHHFKYDIFRRPGDVHVHMFGTATLSVTDGITTQAGDVFEIAAEALGAPLRNPLAIAPDKGLAAVRVL
jgi:hypothetical protein